MIPILTTLVTKQNSRSYDKGVQNKKRKEKSLRGIDRTGQHAYFVLMRISSVDILWSAVFHQTSACKMAASSASAGVVKV